MRRTMLMCIWGIRGGLVDSMLEFNILLRGIVLRFMLVDGMDCLLMMCFMIRAVLLRLMIGKNPMSEVWNMDIFAWSYVLFVFHVVGYVLEPVDLTTASSFVFFVLWNSECWLMTRTQIQIGEIKFNFLLPHQGTLPED